MTPEELIEVADSCDTRSGNFNKGSATWSVLTNAEASLRQCAAMMPYVRHKPECWWYKPDYTQPVLQRQPCSCGLDQIR